MFAPRRARVRRARGLGWLGDRLRAPELVGSARTVGLDALPSGSRRCRTTGRSGDRAGCSCRTTGTACLRARRASPRPPAPARRTGSGSAMGSGSGLRAQARAPAREPAPRVSPPVSRASDPSAGNRRNYRRSPPRRRSRVRTPGRRAPSAAHLEAPRLHAARDAQERGVHLREPALVDGCRPECPLTGLIEREHQHRDLEGAGAVGAHGPRSDAGNPGELDRARSAGSPSRWPASRSPVGRAPATRAGSGATRTARAASHRRAATPDAPRSRGRRCRP